MSIAPEVRWIVWPSRPASKAIVSPPAAAAIAARNDPGPESAALVTVPVAATAFAVQPNAHTNTTISNKTGPTREAAWEQARLEATQSASVRSPRCEPCRSASNYRLLTLREQL